jgi:hypothetical protein
LANLWPRLDAQPYAFSSAALDRWLVGWTHGWTIERESSPDLEAARLR